MVLQSSEMAGNRKPGSHATDCTYTHSLVEKMPRILDRLDKFEPVTSGTQEHQVVSRIFRTFDQATAPVCMTCDW